MSDSKSRSSCWGRASPTYPVSAGAFKQALSNLRPQKTKKTKNWNFRPREAREFLGRWDNNSNTVKTQTFHTSGVCPREDKNSRTKIPDNNSNFRNLRP